MVDKPVLYDSKSRPINPDSNSSSERTVREVAIGDSDLVNLGRKLGGGASFKGKLKRLYRKKYHRFKNHFIAHSFWVFIKIILFLVFSELRLLLFLPYFLTTKFLGGSAIPPIGSPVPILPTTWIPFPVNISGFFGIFLTLALVIGYFFYLNPLKYVYDIENNSFKPKNLWVFGIAVLFTFLIQYGFKNSTISFFSFFIAIILGSYYLGLEKDESKQRFLWGIGVFIAIILFVIFFNKAFVETGRYSSVFEPVADKLGIQGESFTDIWDYVFNPEKAREFGSVEDEELEKKDIGVRIKDFKPVTSTFNSGQQIVARGIVEAASLYSKESSVSFNCELEKYSSEAKSVNPETVRLPGDAIKIVQTVSCIFNDGVNVSKGLETRSVNLISTFDNFYTTSSYNIFSLEAEKYNEIYQQNKNPFDVYGWSKDYLSPGNIMNSKYSPGPVELSIGTENPQPFRSGDKDLFFEVLISKDNQVNLHKINEFKVYIPSDMIEFKDDQHCDLTRSNSENNLNSGSNREVYTIKQSVLDTVNYGNDRISFGCFFNVKELSEEGQFRQDVINAEMNYIFDITEKTPVTIRAIRQSPLLQ